MQHLGLLLDEHLTFTSATDQLVNSASRALGTVIGKTKGNYNLDYNSFTRLYASCVEPITDYASAVWCVGKSTNTSKVDRIQHRAIHFFCGLPKKTPILGLLGDMGWTPGVVRRDLDALRLYNQIVRMPHNRLTRLVMDHDAADGSGDWTSNIGDILKSIGKTDCWESKTAVSIDFAKKELLRMYEQTWLEEVSEKPKLRTYKDIKWKYEAEPHLKIALPKWKHSLISQLRLGVLGIELEKGRALHLPVDKRVCPLCTGGVETELHFLFDCPCYVVERGKLLAQVPELIDIDDNLDKLKCLAKMPNTFRSYVSEIWDKRSHEKGT